MKEKPMRKLLPLGWALATVLTLLALPSVASADSAAHIVVSEVETGTSTSASQEFIELYNPTSTAVLLAGWTIEYKSATATDSSANWTRRATLNGTIAAYGFYLVAPTSYLPNADAEWSPTLAGSGGTVRIKDGGGNVVDKLGYGTTANAAEGSPAAAPPVGQSIERLPGRLDELGGNGTDTDDNSADFILRTQPEPQSTLSVPELPDTAVADDNDTDSAGAASSSIDDSTTDDSTAPDPTDYAPLEITELLVNPMAPQTDAHDEYIELYNPNPTDIDLQGYTLRTGSNFHAYYVLPDTTFPADSYLALYSSQTKLAMPNTGGAVLLLDPSGTQVDETPPYGPAPDGEAWALFDSGWAWTLQLTPGQPNILAALPLTVSPTKAAAHAKAAKKATATTKKKAKAAAKKATKRRKAAKPKTAALKPNLVAERSLQPANWLLIALATLTIGYAIYEFRHDIYNLYQRLRGHAPSGPNDRPTPNRRRGN
jgi:hypothetical protein